MKIPELLLHVVKKSHPEIDDIILLRYETIYVSYNPVNFEPDKGFVVYMNILISKGCNPKMTTQDYSDEINKLFNYTFTDFHYIKFSVEKFAFHKEMTRDEMFSMLFHIDNHLTSVE